jgi:hypothetical protein
MASTLEVATNRFGALISRIATVVEEGEPTSEIAAANPITIGPGGDSDIMMEQRDDTLGETRTIWLDVRDAEALAGAILAHAKVVRGQR